MNTSCQVKPNPSATGVSVGLFLVMPPPNGAEVDRASFQQGPTHQVSVSKLVAPMSVRGTKTLNPEDPQTPLEGHSMVGAVQPLVHLKLDKTEVERFKNSNVNALLDALKRGLPKELGKRAAEIFAPVLIANWEAAVGGEPSLLEPVLNFINKDTQRQIITFALDVSRVEVNGAPLNYESFLNLVGDHVAANKEVAGFVPLASSPGTIILNGQPITVITPEQLKPIQKEARKTKGIRVIPDGEYQAFEDDIEATKAMAKAKLGWSDAIAVPPLPRE